MEDLAGLEGFVATVEMGSISAGARQLGIPRATLSRKLKRLEEHLGVRLFHRSTKTLSLTESGAVFHPLARDVVQRSREAVAAAQLDDTTPRGRIRISIPPNNATLEELLLDFAETWPEIELEVAAMARYVDLAAEGFDLAVRGGRLTGSLIARRVVTLRSGLYASSAYLAEHGAPDTPADLARHACIRSFSRGEVPRPTWPLLDGGAIPIRGKLAFTSLRAIQSAVRRGLGIGLLPFAAVDLQPVLPNSIGETGHLSVVYPDRRLLPVRVRLLVDHLMTGIARRLPNELAHIHSPSGAP